MYGAEYLTRLKPDLLVGGHSFVMDHPAAFIERYRKWSYEMRDAFRALSSESDYRYWFDPFWSARSRIAWCCGRASPGREHPRPQLPARQAGPRVVVHAPPGLVVEPAVLEGELGGASRRSFPIRVKAAPDAPPGVRIVALDVTLDGRRYGEWFDFVVGVESGKAGKGQ